MKHKDLLKRIAKLETVNDQLTAELQFLESLTRTLGFAEGLKTLKEAAQEMIQIDRKKRLKSGDEANPPLSN
jgi:putative heme iron utilization protein